MTMKILMVAIVMTILQLLYVIFMMTMMISRDTPCNTIDMQKIALSGTARSVNKEEGHPVSPLSLVVNRQQESLRQ